MEKLKYEKEFPPDFIAKTVEHILRCAKGSQRVIIPTYAGDLILEIDEPKSAAGRK